MFVKVLLIVLTIGLVGCANNDEPDLPECSRVICTENFVILSAILTDASGNAVQLDGYTVVDTQTGEQLNVLGSDGEFAYNREIGVYVIFNDLYRHQYQNATTTISFTGYISGEAVVNETFEVGADCCHVQLISGNLNLVLD